MRAWQVSRAGEPGDVLELVERPSPSAGPGRLRVAVRAAALGLPDVLMCRSAYPLTPELPFTPGQEVAGVVLDAGDTRFDEGQRVMGVTQFVEGIGGFAEETVIAADNAFAVPDDMSDADAATFRIGYPTAWVALVRRGELVEGDSLLVLGAAGGSGAAAVQLGAALGARVLAVAAGAEKGAYCKELGARDVIDRREVDVGAAVHELTGGRGVDLVFDPVGGDAGEQALRSLAKGGRFLAVGFAAGRWPSVDVARLVGRNASVLGVYVGAYDRIEQETDHTAMLALIEAGRLRSCLASTVSFEGIPEALEVLARGEVIGKTVAVL